MKKIEFDLPRSSYMNINIALKVIERKSEHFKKYNIEIPIEDKYIKKNEDKYIYSYDINIEEELNMLPDYLKIFIKN